ncbi:unnamed protein product, partial [Durusdinium trenchii]
IHPVQTCSLLGSVIILGDGVALRAPLAKDFNIVSESPIHAACASGCEGGKAPRSSQETLVSGGPVWAMPPWREHQWLCQHILESVGEDDLWRIFVRLKDIPAEHLCTAEVRMCSRRLKDDKCLSEANCKGSGQSEGKMSSVGCALQNIELCEFDV